MSDRSNQRNLKKEVGRQAAVAIGAAQGEVQQLAMQHRVLAAQMLDFEKTVAAVRVGRAHDMNQARELVGTERTHRLELAKHQRDYVDRAVTERKLEARAENDLLAQWIRRFESMTFRQRLRWLFAGELTWTPPAATTASAPEPRDSSNAQRARDFHALRPGEENPYLAQLTPAAREAFWHDIGRPVDAHLGAVGGE